MIYHNLVTPSQIGSILYSKTFRNKNPYTHTTVHHWTLDEFPEVELLSQRAYTFYILELSQNNLNRGFTRKYFQ